MEDVVRALVDRMRALVAVYDKGGAAAFQHAFARAAIHVLSRESTGERQRLEAVADSLPGLVGFVDMEARYQYVNVAYETWLARQRIRDRLEALALAGDLAAEDVDRRARERVLERRRAALVEDGDARALA